MTVEEKIDALLNMTLRPRPTMSIRISKRFTYKVNLSVEWPDNSRNSYSGYDITMTDDELPMISLDEALDTIYTKIRRELHEKDVARQNDKDQFARIATRLEENVTNGKKLEWNTCSKKC
jgi:hypothetical protein